MTRSEMLKEIKKYYKYEEDALTRYDEIKRFLYYNNTRLKDVIKIEYERAESASLKIFRLYLIDGSSVEW